MAGQLGREVLTKDYEIIRIRIASDASESVASADAVAMPGSAPQARN